MHDLPYVRHDFMHSHLAKTLGSNLFLKLISGDCASFNTNLGEFLILRLVERGNKMIPFPYHKTY